MQYWLMKSEPDVYGWDDLVAEGEGTWDGVRNYRARNNLAAMEVGDQAFFYHSNIGLEMVGIVEDLIRLLEGVEQGYRAGRHPDPKTARPTAKLLRRLADELDL